MRRVKRNGPRGEVREVDPGRRNSPLHSESSFGATWPEIVWFFCNVPSSSGGSTTLCDGIRLWERLPPNIQSFFIAKPIHYRVAFPTGKPQPGRERVPWPFQRLGVEGEWDRNTGIFHLDIRRFAVVESRSRQLCFVNHLMCGNEPQIESITMGDGAPIPPEIVAEIRRVAGELTFDHVWQTHDCLMIDNRRFLHRRRAFAADEPRDILQIQSQNASFAYGQTTRTPIAR